MTDVRKELEKIIIKALSELKIEAESVHLEHPVDLKMGDYSTNVAMVYAKQSGQNPRELAEKIVEKIPVTGVLEKVEVAGAGFINFYLNKDFFEKSVAEVLDKKDDYGSNENLKGQKILIEHSSPNLFKEFHIGHMVNNSIGESISRIIKKSGADTKVISYPSDVGLGIAKAVCYIDINERFKKHFLSNNSEIKFNDLGVGDSLSRLKNTKDPVSRIQMLAIAYTEGNRLYKEDDSFKIKVDEINKKIYNRTDKKISEIYDLGKKATLEYFEKIAVRLGSKFDDYIFESEAGEVGKKIVKEHTPKVFEESDGAIIFKAEEFDSSLHTRVFINSNNLPTYEAKDLGLLKLKFTKFVKFGTFGFKPDKSIFITDNEQNEYMKVMLKAAEQIKPEWVKKSKHIGHGRLRFPEGRLSSREGNVLTVVDLLEDTKNSVLEKMENFEGDKNKTAEQVAVGAIKYSILKSSAGKNIVFDKEKALALEGNTGPYLQYTYARAKSVLEKAKSEGIKGSTKKNDEEVSEIEKLLYRFPEIVERAGEEYEPHYIATYLFELAQAFNSYYGNNKIADREDKNASYKVALTEAVAQIIKNGLWLLGIEAPERL